MCLAFGTGRISALGIFCSAVFSIQTSLRSVRTVKTSGQLIFPSSTALALVLFCCKYLCLWCFLEVPIKNLVVRLGKFNINEEEPEREQKIQPERIIIHSHFSNVTADSDLALIRLQEDARYSLYVKPICLPLRKKDADGILLKPGRKGSVTGWGRLSDQKDSSGKFSYPYKLQKVILPVVSQTVCKKAIKDEEHVVTNNMFCAGDAKGGRDACQGDSGGPLAIENSPTENEADRRWVLGGVVSWGVGCGRVGMYGVYTRVSAFSRWIYDHINQNP